MDFVILSWRRCNVWNIKTHEDAVKVWNLLNDSIPYMTLTDLINVLSDGCPIEGHTDLVDGRRGTEMTGAR